MKCRHCGNEGFIPFADLHNCPPSNAMLSPATLYEPETFYPLVVQVCDNCRLAQVDEHKKAAEIFDADYTYFSSYSRSWLDHSRRFAGEAIGRLGLGPILMLSNRLERRLSSAIFQAAGFRWRVEPTATRLPPPRKGHPDHVDFSASASPASSCRAGPPRRPIVGNMSSPRSESRLQRGIKRR